MSDASASVVWTDRFLLGTSWKMTKTLGEATLWVEELSRHLRPQEVQLFVLPAHTALARVRDLLGGTDVVVGAQNAHWGEDGAVTGEVSMRMVRDAGARVVEIGHHERRAQHGDTDAVVSAKVAAALRHRLTPLVCVGESRGEHDRGRAVEVVSQQVHAALSRVRDVEVNSLLLAYEPVWSIGAQGSPARPPDVAPVVAAIRDLIRGEYPGVTTLRVLYGGSVDVITAADLVGEVTLDGLFVGRAAWDAAGFAGLASACAAALHTQGAASAPVCSSTVRRDPISQEL